MNGWIGSMFRWIYGCDEYSTGILLLLLLLLFFGYLALCICLLLECIIKIHEQVIFFAHTFLVEFPL